MALTQSSGDHLGSERAGIHIAFGVDSKYLPALAACIYSILQNNRDSAIVFHVITTSLTQSEIDALKTFAETHQATIQLHRPGADKLSMVPDPKFRRFSSAIFNRLLIGEILQGVADRVLYLDADIICLRSLAEIRSIDLGGKIVGAVAEMPQHQNELRAGAGLAPDDLYFNSGVLYIDIEKWNRNHITQKVIQNLLDSYGKYSYPDQDALNRVLKGEVHFLDRRWNLFFNHFKPSSDTVFLHYPNEKPWQVWSNNFGDEDFASSLSATSWAGWSDRAPVSRKQRFRHAKKLFRQGSLVQGLYWYAVAVCTRKSARVVP